MASQQLAAHLRVRKLVVKALSLTEVYDMTNADTLTLPFMQKGEFSGLKLSGRDYPVFEIDDTDNTIAILGKSGAGVGVKGSGGMGVVGSSTQGTGVNGQSVLGYGVYAKNTDPGATDAIRADSSSTQHAAVSGVNSSSGYGVYGSSVGGNGVYAKNTDPNAFDAIRADSNSKPHAAVSGVNSSSGYGVYGSSVGGNGVYAENTDPNATKDAIQGVTSSNYSGVAGVSGINNSNGPGVMGTSKGGPAGHFEGDLNVTRYVMVGGNIKLTSTTGDVTFSDCAEDFDISEVEEIEPGSVMVISQDGVLQKSHQAYDKRVAGVISGAGNLKPGIILGKQQSQNNRMPISLVGKVNCRVDAEYSPIEVGDLLTTSDTPGHAMKVADPLNAFGAVIGKALRPLPAGKGLIPILIALQ
jgi:hypothetical protein